MSSTPTGAAQCIPYACLLCILLWGQAECVQMQRTCYLPRMAYRAAHAARLTEWFSSP